MKDMCDRVANLSAIGIRVSAEGEVAFQCGCRALDFADDLLVAAIREAAELAVLRRDIESVRSHAGDIGGCVERWRRGHGSDACDEMAAVERIAVDDGASADVRFLAQAILDRLEQPLDEGAAPRGGSRD